MREKIKDLKKWVKDHKKRAAGILIAFLLVIGAGIFGMVSVNSANRVEAENKKTEEIKTAKAETKKETKKKEEKEKAEEKKEETDSEEKDTAGKQETQASETTSQSTGTVSAPASGENKGGNQMTTAGSKQESHIHSYTTPVYGTEQRWVVDQAAWTETVNEPIYEMVPVMICNDCGMYLHTGSVDPYEHIENHAMNGGKGSWTDTYEYQQTGTNSYTIDHPEQGHYESYSMVTGYQCSCGAVK